MDLIKHRARLQEAAEKIREVVLSLEKDGFVTTVTRVPELRALEVRFTHPDAPKIERFGQLFDQDYTFLFGIPYFNEAEAQAADVSNGGFPNG